jgi:hypothetical protein
MSYTPPNPNGSATSANSSPVVIASDQVAVKTKLVDAGGTNVASVDVNGAERVYLADPNSTNVSKWSAKQYPYVELDPISDFYDGFDRALDTTNVWTTGGTAPSASVGSLIFNAGTAANAASYLRTKPAFALNASVVNRGGAIVTLASGAETGSKAWWGYGIPATAPTMALPFSDAVVFEIKDTTGALVGAVYSNGVRTQEVALVIPTQLSAPVLSTGRPSDGALHRYAVSYRASKVWFEIDDVMVGYISAPNTSVANLPWTAGVINGVSTLGAARTISISTASSGDTGRNSIKISDGVRSWRKASVDIQGALKVGQGVPSILQTASAVSTGSVASLTVTFPNVNDDGNTIIVSVGVGNGTQPTVTDNNGNTYTADKNVANGTAFNTTIFHASNISSAAIDTITVTNGGTTASIAVEIYEFEGLVLQTNSVVDTTISATGTSTNPVATPIVPVGPNEFFISAIGVGTAAQTITPASGWTNDSGQLNPTTPAGLFSFVSMSQFAGISNSVTPSATIVSEPWAIATVAYRPVFLGIGGSVTAVQRDLTFSGSITTQNLVPAGVATAGSAVLFQPAGHASGVVQVTGTYTGALSLQFSVDNVTWVTSNNPTAFFRTGTSATAGTIGSGLTDIWRFQVGSVPYARITGLAAMTGTAVVTINLSMSSDQTMLAVPIPTGANAIGSITNLSAASAGADGLANPTTAAVEGTQYQFNGTTWDRARNNTDVTVDASAAKTVTVAGATQTNYNARGGIISLVFGTVTGTGPTLAVQLQWSPNGGTTWLSWGPATFAAATPASGNVWACLIYPTQVSDDTTTTLAAFTTGANTTKSLNAPLPRTWRLNYTVAGTSPSITFTALVNYVL